ncbi:RepA [sewage derived gemykibivirus 2]|uniref:RepA n=1 Tax=sewage derived gemykibivirus 2 TaxID=2004968 RepID=A0A0A7CKV7_9VIRU|nr:RepA [Sewage-associated gemycircularvirus 2]AIF34850.1 RepA [Sewage-associated gemycircularvirus 2]
MPNAVTWKLRYGIVTYAQCSDLDPWKVVDMFATISAECIIGREYHEDGGIHLHCFVDFGRIFRSRRVDVFDVEGRHPNVQHVGRTPWVAYDYCIKEGDVVAGAAERPKERRVGLSKPDEIWTEIMAATDRETFFYLCQQLAPRSLCLSFNSITAFAEWKYRVDPEPYQHPDGIEFLEDRVGELHRWAEANLGLRTGGTFKIY